MCCCGGLPCFLGKPCAGIYCVMHLLQGLVGALPTRTHQPHAGTLGITQGCLSIRLCLSYALSFENVESYSSTSLDSPVQTHGTLQTGLHALPSYVAAVVAAARQVALISLFALMPPAGSGGHYGNAVAAVSAPPSWLPDNPWWPNCCCSLFIDLIATARQQQPPCC